MIQAGTLSYQEMLYTVWQLLNVLPLLIDQKQQFDKIIVNSSFVLTE